MTPKEKANELVNKYLISTPVPFHIEDAKKCALIAVDEIFDSGLLMMLDDEQYWHDVKQEIQKI